MSILSGIIDFCRTKILGIETQTSASAVENNTAPVIKCENPGQNEDSLELNY